MCKTGARDPPEALRWRLKPALDKFGRTGGIHGALQDLCDHPEDLRCRLCPKHPSLLATLILPTYSAGVGGPSRSFISFE